MTLLPLLMLLQSGAAVPSVSPRYAQCMDLAVSDPAAALTNANAWAVDGGGASARQCMGVAYTNQRQWTQAAGAFEQAARLAQAAKDDHAAGFWAQAGNAWLAAGEPAKARTALDAALASGTLGGLVLGEAYLDRARALVSAGNMAAARGDLDQALVHASADPLAWLLSATLARRQGDLTRAQTDMEEALKRSADDASVQLEAGNIAAASGDEAGARAAWSKAATLAPGTPAADAARKALAQFDTPAG